MSWGPFCVFCRRAIFSFQAQRTACLNCVLLRALSGLSLDHPDLPLDPPPERMEPYGDPDSDAEELLSPE